MVLIMKRKILGCVGILLAGLLLLVILAWPAAPLLARLGVPIFCIQGQWPNLKLVACPETKTAAPAGTPLPLPTTAAEGPLPIIFDDDGSPDGLLALLYFLRHPGFDVRAVTVSCGEAHPEIFAQHMLKLLAGLGRADIPVGAGRETPLEGSHTFPEPWRQSSDAFWEIRLPEAPVSSQPVPAAELMVQTLSGADQAVLVFVSGNHTNLAEALRSEPGIKTKIRAVHIMGGAIYTQGNITSDWPAIQNHTAEWNIWIDPLAAKEVFASGLPLYLTPLDATNRVLWTSPDAPAWAASGSAEGALAAETLEWMLRAWSPDGVYIWDLAAAVYASDPAACHARPLAVDVITTPGPDEGRTVVSDQPPNTMVCFEPDVEFIKARAASILGR